MNTTIAQQHIETAVQAALLAGNEIMKVYISEDFGVQSKEDSSPVTKADIAASNAIMPLLENTGIPIINEETQKVDYSTRKTWKQVWIVDPLDGTKEFINKNGEFTVNIALIENGKPVLGVIYVPVTDTLYFGIVNQASYVISKFYIAVESLDYNHLVSKAQKMPLANTRSKYTVVASKSHLNAPTQDFINELKKETPDLECVSVGSSLKFCLVAMGKADIYPRFSPTNEWDIAAGDAIARGAGCSVIVAQTGKEMLYNRADLLNPDFVVKRIG